MQEIKNRKNVARFNNEIVEKNLLKFEQKLTINQQKVLYYLIIQEKNGQSLQGISWNNLQERLGISSGEKYDLKRKKNFLKDVQKAQLGIVINEKNMEFHTIFPSIGLRYNKFYYTINPEIISLFDQPELGYYLTNYEYYRDFKHDYSIKIYELLNKELNANDKEKRNYRYTINDLRKYLGVENITSYENFPNFRRIVLEPSLKEINDLTDISIEGALNPKTKKMQLSSKAWGEDIVFIRGISRKTTVQEYVQEKYNEGVIVREEGRTKIDKTPKEEFKENKQTDLLINTDEQIKVTTFGEFGHVKLNEDQYNKVRKIFTDDAEFEQAVIYLDEYLEQNPDKHYANHYISLKQFSKKIIELEKAKKKPNGSYNNNNQTRDTYTEPTYDKFEEDDETILSKEEIEALLDDPFGSSEDKVDNMSEEETKALLENSFGEDNVVESKVDGTNIVEENQKTEIITISTPELADVKQFSFERPTRTEDIHNIPPALFKVAENLYLGFFGGLINREEFDEKLKIFENKYNYKLSSAEKQILFSHAIDTYKWE